MSSSAPRLDDLPDLLNLKEASQVLRISEGNLAELVKSGDLPSVRISPRRVLIPADAIRRRISDAVAD